MQIKTEMQFFLLVLCLLVSLTGAARGGDKEFSGQFDPALVADKDDTEIVVFKYGVPGQLNAGKLFSDRAHISNARLYSPQTDAFSISSMLVEEPGETPLLYVDFNSDNSFGDNEKFNFKREYENDNDYWVLNLDLPLKSGSFASYPIYLNFLKRYKTEKMTDEDRLMKQSTAAFARGNIDFKGKKVLVQYSYDFNSGQVNPTSGSLGVDADGDGEIDMDSTSPEAATVEDETVIFRVGDLYFSTKKADIKKNQIVLTERNAKDYQRIELVTGKELTDFDFVDFNGKKRKLSEFRGKFVLIDVWGLWCPACRDEVPYLREAYKRFQARNFEIIGLNTDRQPVSAVKTAVEGSSIRWTQASFESIVDLVANKMMLHSFPTTILISPEGKIVSLNRTEKGEPDLRGKDLLTSLDKLLPK